MPLTRSASKLKAGKAQRLLDSDDENAPPPEGDEAAFGLRRSRLAPTLADVLSGKLKQLTSCFKQFARNSPSYVAYRFVRDRKLALVRPTTANNNESCQLVKRASDANFSSNDANSREYSSAERDTISVSKADGQYCNSGTVSTFQVLRFWFDFDDETVRFTRNSWLNVIPQQLMEQIDDFVRLDRLRRTVSISHKQSLSNEAEESDDRNDLLNAEYGTLLARVHKEALQHLQKVFDSEFTTSVLFLKYQLDLLTSGRLTVHDVAYYEPLCVHFIEFLEHNGALDLLLALFAFDTFEANVLERAALTSSECTVNDAAQLQTDATALYEKFVSEQGSQTLGFSEPIRSRCESHIMTIRLVAESSEAKANGDEDSDNEMQEDAYRIAAGCFEPARRVLVHALQRVYLGKFVQTEAYYAHVTDLVRRLQHSGLLNSSLRSPQTVNKPEDSEPEDCADDNASHRSVSSCSSVSASHNNAPVIDTRRGSTTCSSCSNNVDWPGSSPFVLHTPTTRSVHAHVNSTPKTLPSRGRNGLLGGWLKSKREKQLEQEQFAAQIARMVIQDVETITTLGASFPNTIDQLPI